MVSLWGVRGITSCVIICIWLVYGVGGGIGGIISSVRLYIWIVYGGPWYNSRYDNV